MAGAGADAAEGAARGDPTRPPRPGERALSPRLAGLGAPGGAGAGLWASGHPWAAGGRRASAAPSPPPGTGSLFINCAVPSARGWELEARLPVGGARGAGSWGPGVAEGVLKKKSSRISLEPGAAWELEGAMRGAGVFVNGRRGAIPRRRGRPGEVSAEPGGQEQSPGVAP